MGPIIICLIAGLGFVIIIVSLLNKCKELERKCQEYTLRYQAEQNFNLELKDKLRKFESLSKPNEV